jgi:hypothetical protein
MGNKTEKRGKEKMRRNKQSKGGKEIAVDRRKNVCCGPYSQIPRGSSFFNFLFPPSLRLFFLPGYFQKLFLYIEGRLTFVLFVDPG